MLTTVIICGLTGFAGGCAMMAATHASGVAGPLLGIVYGVLFALLFSNRVQDRGSGLIWGLAYALLLWLAVVTGLLQLVSAGVTSLGALETNRDNFPGLV